MDDRAIQATRLQDWLNTDRDQLLEQDLGSRLKRKTKNTPSTSSVQHQDQLDERNEVPNEELIKHMSNLPSYLEKGDKKALSFGVLDWRLLEKWQHDHKQTFYPSSSNDSLYFSTDMSSTLSSRGQSCSTDETAVKELNEFQDLKEKLDKPSKTECSLYSKYQSFSKLQKERERDCIEVQRTQKTKTRIGKFPRQVQKLEDLGSGINRNYLENGQNQAPSDDFERKHCGGINQSSSAIKFLSKPLESPSPSSKSSISPSRQRTLEDRSPKIVDRSEPIIGNVENKLRNTSPSRMLSLGLSRFNRRSNSLDLSSVPIQMESQRKKEVDYSASEIPKLTYPSQSHRFNIGLNRSSRRSSSLDFSNVPRLSSQHDPYTSQSNKNVGFCPKNSSNDKLNVGRKSQMSPLRRLFDPLLKAKAVKPDHCAYSSEKDSEISYLYEPTNGKHKPSTVQALVQLSIKNGLPLYTFADDKNSGVLAATMKKVSALKKGESSWMYTFFNVDEVKKKSGWINKGRKGETHDYIPSVVAQMRVSDIRRSPINKFSTMEFVSFSVDVSENDQQVSNFRPKDELAAIIVKFHKDDPSCRDEVKKGSHNVSDPLFSLTVILPGGSHGLPTEGKPSPLIERWKSCGSCDCGGWDLGCRLEVFTSQAESNRRSSFSDTFQAAVRFEIFPQGKSDEDRPVFILSPFKDNVYSVEFDSSLSFLQAFSICISILNSRKPYDLSELSKLLEGKTENTLGTDDVIKAPNPPLSPVGRV